MHKISDLKLVEFEDVFSGRSSITELEMFEFQMSKLLTLIVRRKIHEIEAMYIILDNLDLNEEYYRCLNTMLILMRIDMLEDYLDNHN